MVDLNKEDNIKHLFKAYKNREDDIKWNPSNFIFSEVKCCDKENDIEFKLKIVLVQEQEKSSYLIIGKDIQVMFT